jgi:hypothetical protein
MMYACKNCNQVFDVKPDKHGKVKTPSRELEYVPCDGEIVKAEIREVKRKKRIQYLFQFIA